MHRRSSYWGRTRIFFIYSPYWDLVGGFLTALSYHLVSIYSGPLLGSLFLALSGAPLVLHQVSIYRLPAGSCLLTGYWNFHV
jgi:hypothetical protein